MRGRSTWRMGGIKMVMVANASTPDNASIQSAKADPCSALWGSLKTDCEKSWLGQAFGDNPGGTTGTTTGNSSTSIWDLFTNPVTFFGGIRHVFTRIFEVITGSVLILIGINALVKSQTGVNVGGTATKAAKKIGKAAVA